MKIYISKIQLISFFIILFIFYQIIYGNIAFCQDHSNPPQSYIHSLSDSEFDTWLENANIVADRLNLNFQRTRSYHNISIEDNIRRLINPQPFNLNISIVADAIINDSRALIFNQNISIFYLKQIPMSSNNQLMPLEMYLDCIENLVLNFNSDWISVNSAKNLLASNSQNINLQESLLKLNSFENIITNNVVELQRHSSTINFNNIYTD